MTSKKSADSQPDEDAEASPQPSGTQYANDQGSLSGKRRALGSIRRELSEDELDGSPGARKLVLNIIDSQDIELEELRASNRRLQALLDSSRDRCYTVTTELEVTREKLNTAGSMGLIENIGIAIAGVLGTEYYSLSTSSSGQVPLAKLLGALAAVFVAAIILGRVYRMVPRKPSVATKSGEVEQKDA